MLHRYVPAMVSLPLSLLKAMTAVLLSGVVVSVDAANVPPEPDVQAAGAAVSFVPKEACLPETVVPVVSPPSVPVPVLDHGCWMGYAEAEKLSPLWVDVRPLPETRAAPIPGALQISPYQLFAKNFLKEMPVVLIGNGVDDAEMAMACSQLKEAGFTQARILRHGMRAWYRAGQLLLGNAETIMALDTIDAGYFHRGQIAKVWQVVGINLPEEASIAYTVNAKNIDQAVNQIRSLIQKRRQVRVGTEISAYVPTTVIVAADETTTQQLRQQWHESLGTQDNGASDNDVLWLVGGWRDYVAFVEQQQRMAAIAANPPPLRRPCGL